MPPASRQMSAFLANPFNQRGGACETRWVQLPPEDQPDTIDIGPVKGIPIFHDDDPRLEEDRALWSAATRKAQALHSADELLAGLRDHDWRVRHESVDRLVARAKDEGLLRSQIGAVQGHPAVGEGSYARGCPWTWFLGC